MRLYQHPLSLARILPLAVLSNTGIAGVLWLASPSPFWDYWVVSNCIGLSICVLEVALLGRFPASRWRPLLSMIGISGGTLFGLWLASRVGSDSLRQWFHLHPEETLRYTLLGVIIGITFTAIWQGALRLRELENARKEAELREMRQEKQALTAHLKLLQAQIEPHFLFNTLANLHSLIDTRPALARRLLEHLNDYLRASLSHSRAEQATLGDECRLLTALLDIHAIRMGERLQVVIDIPEALHALPLPPMLVQPLVENALQHGLEPKIDGGEIRLTARREGNALHLTVSDNGLGFTNPNPDGVGLANIRERLYALYGERAQLSLRANIPSGVIAELCLPLAP